MPKVSVFDTFTLTTDFMDNDIATVCVTDVVGIHV